MAVHVGRLAGIQPADRHADGVRRQIDKKHRVLSLGRIVALLAGRFNRRMMQPVGDFYLRGVGGVLSKSADWNFSGWVVAEDAIGTLLFLVILGIVASEPLECFDWGILKPYD